LRAIELKPPCALALLCLSLGIVGCHHDWDRAWRGADASIPAPDGRGDDASAVQGEWTRLSAGTFSMGATAGEPCNAGNETQHTVTLTRCFDIMRTEVARDAFAAAMGYEPLADDTCTERGCPVRNVSWHEAAAYCNRLSAGNDLASCYSCSGAEKEVSCEVASRFQTVDLRDCPGYRLPTEAEWEYACRAGTTTALYNGKLGQCKSADPGADQIAWYVHNAGDSPRRGATRAPNAWGLFDMAGNVYEWCHDPYQPDLGAEEVRDPIGLGFEMNRVIRGGAYTTEPSLLRAAARGVLHSNIRVLHGGFRCVRTAPVALQVVVNGVLLPESDTEYAFDLDGSGAKNQLGSIFNTIKPLIDLEQEFQRELETGTHLMIFEVYTDSLAGDADARVQVHVGEDLDEDHQDNFSGSEPLGLSDESPSGSVLHATTSGGRVDGGPGTITIPLPLIGPSLSELRLAHVLLEESGGQAWSGVLAGAITEDELYTVLLPAIANKLTELIGPGSSLSQHDKDAIKTVFDTNSDGVIEASELKNNPLVTWPLPDVDTDGDGKNDGHSMGIGFTAVSCVIQRR
jgi:formylglycine-generating enzyme required for sulfatase activity